MVELLPAAAHFIGPTWRKTVDGKWYLPEKSLGWQVIDWIAEYVNSPAGDHAGQAFMPTLEQARFILWWYAVDNEGKFIYREGCLRRQKGGGKDVVAAALALVELCGPVVFSGWDAKGNPTAKPRHAAWVTVAAVSLDQSKNTFSLFPVMISKKMKQTYGMEINKFIIYTSIGGRLEAASSSPASLEGNRPTFLIQNEIQYWGAGPGGEYNNGHEMAAVIEGNITKVAGARILSICNAHIPGNDSVGERIYKAWEDIQAGKAVDTGLLYDALEAPADTPISEIPSESVDPEGYAAGVEKLREGLMIARGDSYWLPVDEILKSVLDVKNSITESRRKFLNQVNASEDSWIAPYEWDVCLKEDVEPLQLGERVALGFDGSKSNDHTALCVCRISDGALFLVRTWVPGNYSNGEIPRDDVDAYVRSMFEKYDVVVFRADVKEFEAYVDQWSRDFKKKIKVNASPGHPIAFDMRGNQKKFAFDCERFLDAVLEQELIHDGNPVLRQHVLNAKRNPTTWDAISIRKTSRDSPRKIDAAVTAVLAWGARQEYLVSKNNKSQGGRVFK